MPTINKYFTKNAKNHIEDRILNFIYMNIFFLNNIFIYLTHLTVVRRNVWKSIHRYWRQFWHWIRSDQDLV